MIKKEIAQNEGRLLREERDLPRTYSATEHSEEQWKKSRDVANEEWTAIRTRDRAQYEAIDRSCDALRGKLDGGDMEVRDLPNDSGILIEADVWPRPAQSAQYSVEPTALGPLKIAT